MSSRITEGILPFDLIQSLGKDEVGYFVGAARVGDFIGRSLLFSPFTVWNIFDRPDCTRNNRECLDCVLKKLIKS
jgi:hypothetical protein